MSNPVQVLTLLASDKGTYAITNIQFIDEDNTPVTPNTDTVKYCLTDKAGNVINDKKEIAITSALTMQIVLSGDDLAVSGTPDKIVKNKDVTINQFERHIAVSGEVNSTLGDDLPVTKEFVFYIEDIVCI